MGLESSCEGACEIDDDAIKVYGLRFPGTPQLGDIAKLVKGAIPKCKVILGGWPCVSFSQAGRRLGFNDERGMLFFRLADVIRSAMPGAILLENVDTLVTRDGGRTMSTVVETLKGIGYSVSYSVLDALDFGVPQHRNRVYIVGFRDAATASRFRFPDGTGRTSTVADILEGSDAAAGYHVSKTAMKGMRERRIKHERKGNGFGYAVLSLDGHAHTLLAGGQGLERNLIPDTSSPTGHRWLTPLECERLMGMPDAWTAGVSETARYRLTANSVAVPVVRAVCREMLSATFATGASARRSA
jgi:DNA (cytosine-5)-methyltransferase 1